MNGGMSCGKTFRSTEPQADKKEKLLTERVKATLNCRLSQSVRSAHSKIRLSRMLSTVFASVCQLLSG